MAIHGLAHPDGEIATARAAATAGVPFTLSTMSSRSIEEVAEAAPDGIRWFQLYVQRDPGASQIAGERAAAAGYGAIVLTVDLPVLGYRERDLRSGFELSSLGNFRLGPTTARSDRWSRGPSTPRMPPVEGLVWDDLASIRSWSTLPLVLKGILTAEDARLAVEHGVDAIVVSNHGARQLDRVPRRSTSSPRSSRRSMAGPRSGSMAASGAVSISPSRSRSARRRPRRPARSCGRWRPAARRASSAPSRSSARSSRSPWRSSGRRRRPTSGGAPGRAEGGNRPNRSAIDPEPRPRRHPARHRPSGPDRAG